MAGLSLKADGRSFKDRVADLKAATAAGGVAGQTDEGATAGDQQQAAHSRDDRGEVAQPPARRDSGRRGGNYEYVAATEEGIDETVPRELRSHLQGGLREGSDGPRRRPPRDRTAATENDSSGSKTKATAKSTEAKAGENKGGKAVPKTPMAEMALKRTMESDAEESDSE